MPTSPPRCGAAPMDVFASSPSPLSSGALYRSNGRCCSEWTNAPCFVAMPSLALVDVAPLLLDRMSTIEQLAACLQTRLQKVKKVQNMSIAQLNAFPVVPGDRCAQLAVGTSFDARLCKLEHTGFVTEDHLTGFLNPLLSTIKETISGVQTSILQQVSELQGPFVERLGSLDATVKHEIVTSVNLQYRVARLCGKPAVQTANDLPVRRSFKFGDCARLHVLAARPQLNGSLVPIVGISDDHFVLTVDGLLKPVSVKPMSLVVVDDSRGFDVAVSGEPGRVAENRRC